MESVEEKKWWAWRERIRSRSSSSTSKSSADEDEEAGQERIDLDNVRYLDGNLLTKIVFAPADRRDEDGNWWKHIEWGKRLLLWVNPFHEYCFLRRERSSRLGQQDNGSRKSDSATIKWCKRALNGKREKTFLLRSGNQQNRRAASEVLLDHLFGLSLCKVSKDQINRTKKLRKLLKTCDVLLSTFAGHWDPNADGDASKVFRVFVNESYSCTSAECGIAFLDTSRIWGFNIFYQLVGLARICNYSRLDQSYNLFEEKNEEGFARTQKFLKGIGMDPTATLRVLRAILELGHLEFQYDNKSSCGTLTSTSGRRLVSCGKLFGWGDNVLRKVKMILETSSQPAATVEQLAKCLYLSLLNLILKCMNLSLQDLSFTDSNSPNEYAVNIIDLANPDWESVGHSVLCPEKYMRNMTWESINSLCDLRLQQAESRKHAMKLPQTPNTALSATTAVKTIGGLLSSLQLDETMQVQHAFGIVQYNTASFGIGLLQAFNKRFQERLVFETSNGLNRELFQEFATHDTRKGQLSYLERWYNDVPRMLEGTDLHVAYCIPVGSFRERFENGPLSTRFRCLVVPKLVSRANERSAKFFPIRICLETFLESYAALFESFDIAPSNRRALSDGLAFAMSRILGHSEYKVGAAHVHLTDEVLYVLDEMRLSLEASDGDLEPRSPAPSVFSEYAERQVPPPPKSPPPPLAPPPPAFEPQRAYSGSINDELTDSDTVFLFESADDHEIPLALKPTILVHASGSFPQRQDHNFQGRSIDTLEQDSAEVEVRSNLNAGKEKQDKTSNIGLVSKALPLKLDINNLPSRELAATNRNEEIIFLGERKEEKRSLAEVCKEVQKEEKRKSLVEYVRRSSIQREERRRNHAAMVISMFWRVKRKPRTTSEVSSAWATANSAGDEEEIEEPATHIPNRERKESDNCTKCIEEENPATMSKLFKEEEPFSIGDGSVESFTEEEISSACEVQRIVRGALLRRKVRGLLARRRPWQAQLRPNEALVISSQVIQTVHHLALPLKRDNSSESPLSNGGSNMNFGADESGSNGASSPRSPFRHRRKLSLIKSRRTRYLIFTSGPFPRLFYVNDEGQFKGDIPWEPNVTHAIAYSDTIFVIHSAPDDIGGKEKTKWEFTLVHSSDGPSAFDWVEALKKCYMIQDLLSLPGGVFEYKLAEPVLIEGCLMRQSKLSRSIWKEQWFVLRRSSLRWFKKRGDIRWCGNILIDELTAVYATSDKSIFELKSPRVKVRIKLKASNRQDLSLWVDALQSLIKFHHYATGRGVFHTDSSSSLQSWSTLSVPNDLDMSELIAIARDTSFN